jgi:serine/threonine protein phosphatase PrpC
MKILYLENHERFARQVIAQFLREHEVTVVPSITLAREQIAANRYNVLLLDQDLDDGKGSVLARELRAAGYTGSIIAASAHAEGNEALRLAGADAVCGKLDFARIGEILANLKGLIQRPVCASVRACRLVIGASSSCQDRAEIFAAPDRTVLVLADGAGGVSGGDRAASRIVETLREAVLAPESGPSDWGRFLTRLDRTLLDDPEAGESTVVVVEVGAKAVSGASVGDSGAWLVARDGRIDELTAQQSRKPLLGSGRARPTRFQRAALDGTLLVASDGLLKYAPHARIAATVARHDLDECARRLVDLVRLRSGALQDDVALILCRSLEPR